MKELKKRVKGLSAILLAVCLALCLVVRFSGVSASAEGTQISVDDNGYNGNTIITACENMEFSEVGAGLKRDANSSGGFFAIEYETGNSDNMEKYLQLGTKSITDDNSKTEYYDSVKISQTLPTQYKSIKITACTKVTYINDDGVTSDAQANDYHPIYKLTFAWVPNTTISVGQTVSLTTGTQYSFSGTGTYKVQGDPTVYHATDFYVSQDGTYTIEQ